MVNRKPIYDATVDDLVEALNELQSCDDVKEEDGTLYFSAHPELTENESDIVYCECLCNELLISAGGGCNLENIDKVRKAGYKIYPGEKDSFGWLSGCVENLNTRKILVYG